MQAAAFCHKMMSVQRIKLSKLQNKIASGNKSKFGLRKCSLKAQSRNIYIDIEPIALPQCCEGQEELAPLRLDS